MNRQAIPPEKGSAAQQFVLPDEAVQEDFHRGLKERHIQMIAIGGAIGVGLFLGSAKAIQQAGPLGKVSRHKVPAAGMMVSFVAMLAGVVLNDFISASAFAYITSIATVCGLFVWGMVMFSHLSYRRAVNAGRLPEGSR
jgi:L-asparagine transporter-like permease